MSENKTKMTGWKWFLLSVAVFAAMGVFCIRLFYGHRFPTGSQVAGLRCGGMEAEDVAVMLRETAASRELVCTDEDGEALCALPLTDVIGEVDYDALSAELLKSNPGGSCPLSFSVEASAVLPLVEAQLFDEDYEAEEPQDACITADEEGVRIERAVLGNIYVPEAFAEAVCAALEEGISLSGEEILIPVQNARTLPGRTEDDPLLQTQLAALTKWTDKQVTLSFLPGLEYTLTPEDIFSVLNVEYTDEGAEVSLNEEALGEMLNTLIDELGADGVMAKYGRCADTREYLYLLSDDCGFPLDREKLIFEARSALLGNGGTVEGVYDYPAFLKKKYGWMGDLTNVLEVSVDNQYLWFYHDGQLLTECPVVTGDLATNSITRKGIFQIYGMVADTNLKGPTWDDHVDYWMPFDGDIGIHDSSWRDEYGGDIYKESGSHGCVNTPLESMGIIYNNSFYGMLVIVR